MTVEDLILRLRKCPKDALVIRTNEGGGYIWHGDVNFVVWNKKINAVHLVPDDFMMSDATISNDKDCVEIVNL